MLTVFDFFLQTLEEEYNKATESEKKDGEGSVEKTDSKEAKSSEDKSKSGDQAAEGGDTEMSEEKLELQKKAKEYLEAKGSDNGDATRGKKRKRERTKEFDDESSGSESSEDEDANLPPGMDKKNGDGEKKEDESDEKKDEEGEEDGETEKKSDDDNNVKEEESKEEVKMEEDGEEKPKDVAAADKKNEEGENGGDESKPRALHKTASIFLRNLSPTITKQEVEAMCKRYPGFLRAAIADPQPDRRWFRRGWVTFERHVKIKDICFNLNTIRLRDCELGPIVNRDLTRRIRTVSGITVDKKVVRNDIKMAAKVITNLDRRWGLWQVKTEGEGGAGDEKKKTEPITSDDMIGIGSTNPVLDNITDYLIEEASAEEEELLGKNNDLEDGEEGEEGNSITRDEELIKVLDKMLLYLRIVHSVDFYNHSEYPNEDEMPNRCVVNFSFFF